MLREHPRFADFEVWITQQRTNLIPLRGDYYRVAGPRHTTAKEIVSGVGAFIAGGRWNPKNVMNVVYLSDDSITATAESIAHFRYYQLPTKNAFPKVIVCVEVELETVLDLTEQKITEALPIEMTSLLAEDWRAIMSRGEESSSQALSRAAYLNGIQGLIVPSIPKPSSKNLVIFPQNLSKSCRLVVANAEVLDTLGKGA